MLRSDHLFQTTASIVKRSRRSTRPVISYGISDMAKDVCNFVASFTPENIIKAAKIIASNVSSDAAQMFVAAPRAMFPEAWQMGIFAGVLSMPSFAQAAKSLEISLLGGAGFGVLSTVAILGTTAVLGATGGAVVGLVNSGFELSGYGRSDIFNYDVVFAKRAGTVNFEHGIDVIPPPAVNPVYAFVRGHASPCRRPDPCARGVEPMAAF